jgi:ABC-type transport system substrate-binding protein
MKTILLGLILVSLLSCSSAETTLTAIERHGWPRLDEVYMKVIQNPDAAATAFQSCEVDFLPDMIRWANVQKLTLENQKVIASPGYHFCYIAFNCRDYVPNDAGQPDAGRPLAPLNWSGFRQALAWAGLSHAEKETAILEFWGGPIITAVDSPVPPALGVWHKEPPKYPGCNYTRAWEVLQASGFSISDGKLIQPNGIQARDQVELISPIGPALGGLLWTWVEKWNDFFDNFLGVTNCNFMLEWVDFGQVLVPRAFTYRNFDAYFYCCYGFGRFPDYLYDYFHSSRNYPDGSNSAGLNDSELDELLETIRYSMVYEEKLQACYDAQDKLVFEDCPYVYAYSRTYFFAFKNYTQYTAEPEWLEGMVSQKGYGADNPWTWGNLHWNTAPTGGVVKYVLGGNLASLHPGWASLDPGWPYEDYEWHVLKQVEDGLLATDPEMVDLPWIAADWSIEPFVYEPLGINGSRVRFQIREGVKWHDLKPVTVEDVAFALNYSRGFPNLQPIWQYLLWTQIVDPYTIDVYTNTTSYWILYDLANLGTRFPKHIYNKPGSTTATLWNITYEQWTGQPPPPEYPFMKALIGCGPYVFDYWNATAGTVHLVKFQEYWVNSPVKSCVVLPQRVEPNAPFNYTIEIVNTGSADDITGEFVPAVIDNVAVRVNGQLGMVIPGPIVVQPFERVVLGPFTTSLEKGSQSIECDVMAYGETIDHYTCHCWSTIKEDVNLDIYVGIDDIFTVAGAFGSLPGEINWNECYDMNNDYYVGIDDIFQIATKFGWDP